MSKTSISQIILWKSVLLLGLVKYTNGSLEEFKHLNPCDTFFSTITKCKDIGVDFIFKNGFILYYVGYFDISLLSKFKPEISEIPIFYYGILDNSWLDISRIGHIALSWKSQVSSCLDLALSWGQKTHIDRLW